MEGFSLRTQMYFRLSLLSAKNNFHFGGDKGQPEKRLRSQARKVFEQLRNVFGLFSVYSLVSDQFNIVE